MAVATVCACDKAKTNDGGSSSGSDSSDTSQSTQESTGDSTAGSTSGDAMSSDAVSTSEATDSQETGSDSTDLESTQEDSTSTSGETSESTSQDSSSDGETTTTTDSSQETTSDGGELPACDDLVNDDIAVFKSSCLVWQRKINDKLPWREYEPGIDTAPKFCDELEFAGLTEWRLPTVDELKTIVVTGVYPTADLEIFPDTPFGALWSSEEVAGNHVTVIDFSNGATATFGTDGPQNFRCVHATK